MKKTLLCSILTAATALTCLGGDFAAIEKESDCELSYRGIPLISQRLFTIEGKDFLSAPGTQSEKQELPDGSVVFNRWNTQKDNCFREEIAISPSGDEIEISFQTFFESYSPVVMTEPHINYELDVPLSLFEGGSFAGFVGRGSSMKPLEGPLSADGLAEMRKGSFRYIAFDNGKGDSLAFDFNISGVSDMVSDYSENCLIGHWGAVEENGTIRLISGMQPSFWGAPFTAKVKIFRGDREHSYDQRHAFRHYSWGTEFPPELLYCFGAKKYGKGYAALNTQKFDGKAGWTSGTETLQLQNESPEGAFYSAVTGHDATLKIAGLRDGIYFVTLGTGNLNNADVEFEAAVNGCPFPKPVSVPRGTASTAAMPIQTVNGEITVEFVGDFRLSTLGLQCLQATAEDLNFNREFWRTYGFEPAPIYANGNYTTPPVFESKQENFDLPVPGTEASGELKTMVLEHNAITSKGHPQADWRFNANIQTFGPNNAGVFTEYGTDEALKQRIMDLKQRNISVILTNGMLSRHTYAAHEPRVKQTLKRFTDLAHANGLKLMDHQDATLLWNIDAGNRVCCERFSELQVQTHNQMPSPYFCTSNPEFRKAIFASLKDYVVSTGCDALMLDEVMMMEGCCSCAYCRKQFHEDTGWYLPVNELDPAITGEENALRKTWIQWRIHQIGNFFVELRKQLNEVNPDFSLVAYTTHYCLTSRYSSHGYGLDIIEMARGVDFPGSEITSRNTLRSARAVSALRACKSMLHLAYDVPVWGLISSGDRSYAVDYFGWAVNNMHGQSTWMNDSAPRPANLPDFTVFPGNMNRQTAQSVAEVALLFSIASRDFGGGFNYTSELLGTAQTLGSMHVPYDVIGEISLNPEALKKYKVLFLGCSSALSDRAGEVIKEFARQGGTVYLTTTAGWENEYGFSRKEWLFKDVFNHDINRQFIRPKTITDPETGEEVTLDFEPYYCHPDYTAEGPRPTSSLLWARNADGARYPLMLHKKYGKGEFYYQPITLAFHLNAPEGYVGNPYDFAIDPWLDKTLRGILAKIMDKALFWEVDAPDLVLTTIYQQDNELLCHFLNATIGPIAKNEITTYGVPEPAFPPMEKDITFTVPVSSPSRVYAVSPDFYGEKDLEFSTANGKTTVILPKELLYVYTIVKIRE